MAPSIIDLTAIVNLSMGKSSRYFTLEFRDSSKFVFKGSRKAACLDLVGWAADINKVTDSSAKNRETKHVVASIGSEETTIRNSASTTKKMDIIKKHASASRGRIVSAKQSKHGRSRTDIGKSSSSRSDGNGGVKRFDFVSSLAPVTESTESDRPCRSHVVGEDKNKIKSEDQQQHEEVYQHAKRGKTSKGKSRPSISINTNTNNTDNSMNMLGNTIDESETQDVNAVNEVNHMSMATLVTESESVILPTPIATPKAAPTATSTTTTTTNLDPKKGTLENDQMNARGETDGATLTLKKKSYITRRNTVRKSRVSVRHENNNHKDTLKSLHKPQRIHLTESLKSADTTPTCAATRPQMQAPAQAQVPDTAPAQTQVPAPATTATTAQ